MIELTRSPGIGAPGAEAFVRPRMRTLGRRAFVGLLAGAAALAVSGCGGPPMVRAQVGVTDEPGQPVEELNRAVTTLGGRLLAALGTERNIICSPLSIMMVMAMVRNGAAGATAAEMDTALGLPPVEQMNRGLAHLRVALPGRTGKIESGSRSGEISINLANQVFGRPDVPWSSAYLEPLARWYDTGVAEIDFTDPTAASKMINDWIGDRTEGRIEDLIDPEMITAETAIALVNALYFAAPWSEVFDESGPAPFTTAGGASVEVPMLHGSGRWSAAVGDHYTAVSIPYLGADLAMTVALPHPGDDRAMLDDFADGEWAEALAAAESVPVDLTMPGWTHRSRFALKDVLGSLGMSEAFDRELADFSPMTDGAVPIWISEVLHGGWIAVDAEGTEAAAATVAMAGVGAAPAPEGGVTLVLDRPFAYAVTDTATGTALLAGWVADPSTD